MRWILALIVLAGGAWYLNSRRRAGMQQTIQYEMPSELHTEPANATATPRDETAGNDAPSMAAAATGAISEQAAEVAQKATDAAGSVQQAASAMAGRVEQAAVESAPAAGADTATADGSETAPQQTAGQSDTPRPVGAPIGAPDAPDEDVQVIGMEHAPEVDREEVLQRSSGEFIGNKSTRVFHAASANNLPAEDNRVYFDSEEEALAAGFRPAAHEGLESAES